MSKEITIPSNFILSTTTDTHGNITSASDHFLQVSGFTRDEVVGQPHNIVRHPDVPKQVFADMWATIQNKEIWTGIVKNKTKQGDYYYVRANVTPLLEEGDIVGFVSIRTPASAKDVAEAQRIYPQIQKGKKRLCKGVVRTRRQALTDRFSLKGSLTKTLSLTSLAYLSLAILTMASLFYVLHISKVEPRVLLTQEEAASQQIEYLIAEKIEGVKNIAFAYAAQSSLVDALQYKDEYSIELAHEAIASIQLHFAAISDYRRLRASLIDLDGRVLARSYQLDTEYSDDFALMPAVAHTYQGVGGISWGTNDIGFGASGYGPIFSEEGYLLGAVVVSGGFGSVARELRKQQRNWLILLDSTQLLKEDGQLPPALLNNQKVGEGYMLANNNWFEAPMVDFVTQKTQSLNLAQPPAGAELLQDRIVIQLPLFNGSGEIIGRHVFKENNHAVINELKQEMDNAILFLSIIGLAILIIIGLLIKSVYRRVVAPIKRATERLENTTKTYRFNNRIVELDRGDEVSRIFRAYNQQANALQLVFSNIIDVMNSVQQGDYSHRIETDLTGDLRTIKAAINTAIAKVDEQLSLVKHQAISAHQSDAQEPSASDRKTHQAMVNQLLKTNTALKLLADEVEQQAKIFSQRSHLDTH